MVYLTILCWISLFRARCILNTLLLHFSEKDKIVLWYRSYQTIHARTNIRGSVASRMNASSVHVTRDQPIGRRPIQRCFGCSIVSTRHTLYFELKDKFYNWSCIFSLNFIFSCKIHKTFLVIDCRRLLPFVVFLYWFIINVSPRKNLSFTFHHRYETLDCYCYLLRKIFQFFDWMQ